MEKTLKVDVVNAEESLFSGNAEFVALPGIEGELGILPGHTPLITLIRPGLVRIRKSAQDEEEIFVAGGVLEIQPFHVIVLADVAIRSKDLDEAKAKEAMEKAKPALLEPFMTLHVYIDEQFTGDIMGHFNKKRARVMGSEILEDGLIKITAEAPQEEVMNYAVDLRAMTQGQGFFDMEFLGYEFAPEHVAKRVIANHQQ